jgi:SAM-dependent methyltransferase
MEERAGGNAKVRVIQTYRRLYRAGASPSLPVLGGRAMARSLGYPEDVLRAVDDALWNRFFPCGNPLPYLDVRPGQRILNLGSGVGLDAFFMRQTLSSAATVVNLDIAYEALAAGLRAFGKQPGEAGGVHWVQADGEILPFTEKCFHWIVLNGVFNVFPEKERIVRELARVAAPCGRLVVADLVRNGPLPDECRNEPEGWVWCLNGSETCEEIVRLMEGAGFLDVRFHERICEAEPFWRSVFTARRGPA